MEVSIKIIIDKEDFFGLIMYRYMIIQQRRRARQRIIGDRLNPRNRLKDRQNPLEEYSDLSFQVRYRFTKQSFVYLLDLILPQLMVDPRGNPLPPVLQLAAFLRFAATGSFQQVLGDSINCAKGTVSKYIRRLALILAELRPRYINFRPGAHTMAAFREIAGFPTVVGAIDCTHVPVFVPKVDDVGLYLCHKGFTSINVQVVCGPDMRICHIVSRWPGSTHDSRIFDWSSIKEYMIEQRTPHGQLPPDSKLLGDGGYACMPYLFTPLRAPQTRPEIRYNFAHSRTRTVVERVFGVLKRRFPCLRRKLHFKEMDTCKLVIVACAVLYNLCINLNEPDVDGDDIFEEENAENRLQLHGREERGAAAREAFIQAHFTD